MEHNNKGICEVYKDRLEIRGIIQAIPFVGSSIDTLLAGYGAQISERRFLEFINHLDARLSELEFGRQIEPTEELWDLFVTCSEGVMRSRTEEKRKRFANIIANKITHNEDTDEAIDAVKLLNQCEDIHVEILKIGMETPSCPEWDGSKVFAVMKEESLNKNIPNVCELLAAKYQEHHIVAACCQLVGFGLLYDDGVGRLAPAAMTHFVLTDTGKCFLDWISD